MHLIFIERVGWLMTVKDKRITVLGGGIAGLAVATLLAQRGAAVTLLEQAPEIREFGAGLQISPNGMAVLRAMGLAGALANKAPRAGAVVLRDGERGARLLRMDMARRHPDWEFRLARRGDLIAILADAARAAGVQTLLLHHVVAVELGDHAPRLKTAQGACHEAPLVIGADGLHSRVREALNGRVEPFFTGQVAWRAVIEDETGPSDGTPAEAELFVGPGRHLVSYPLGDGRMRNIVAVEERYSWAEESWNTTDDPMALREAFAGFCPRVRGWLDRVGTVHLWGLFRHPVAERWHGQGAAILGDAAHSTLPFLAQGANMALEDAWVLAEMLESYVCPDAALAAYQAAREKRVRRIVDAANRNARAYHLSGVVRQLAHIGLRLGDRMAPGMALERFDWLYGVDVTRADHTAPAAAPVPA